MESVESNKSKEANLLKAPLKYKTDQVYKEKNL